jgi:hypothetical protein
MTEGVTGKAQQPVSRFAPRFCVVGGDMAQMRRMRYSSATILSSTGGEAR